MSDPSQPAGWVVVVPVRPAGKSRLAASPEFARAIALDTIEAALAARSVAEVVVPTADAVLASELHGFAPRAAGSRGAALRVVVEADAAGISAAIARALEGVGVGAARAVLLGDVPALRPDDLDAALALAASHDRAFVRDVEGDGTTLVTASGGCDLRSAFGVDSAAHHAALGLADLAVPAASTLRRDVDTPAQLAAAAELGLGPRTRAVLAAG